MPKKLTTRDALIAALGALVLLGFCLVNMYWLPEDGPPAGFYAKAGTAR